ncbi:MAG: N-acetylmuramoyl-L-alanine amidase [Rhodospirillaceae bacterium]
MPVLFPAAIPAPIIERPSPNQGQRPGGGAAVDILLVHFTGLPTAAVALERLTQLGSGVSCHYTVDEDGTIYRHVAEECRAWHAGIGSWLGCRDINSRSIGVELVNPGHEFGYRPFPAEQMAAFSSLACDIIRRHAILPERVLGHSDIAPARKQDPGELFDWRGLAADGIGIWPESGLSQLPSEDDSNATAGEVASMLTEWGYDVEGAGLPLTLLAFQRHFHPGWLSGLALPETVRRLRALLRMRV